MAKFTVTIPDEFEFGVAAARESYNAQHENEPDFVPLTEDGEYIQMVVERAAESWHRQHSVPPSAEQVDRLEAENAQLRAQLAEASKVA